MMQEHLSVSDMELITEDNIDEKMQEVLDADQDLLRYLESLEQYKEAVDSPELKDAPFDPLHVFESLPLLFSTTGATMAEFCQFSGIRKSRLKALIHGRKTPTEEDCDGGVRAVEMIMGRAKHPKYKKRMMQRMQANIRRADGEVELPPDRLRPKIYGLP